MTIELRTGDRDAFFEAPFHAYRRADGYVSPLCGDVLRMLDPEANPLWKAGNPFRFWTVHREGRPIGRIVAHVHGQSNARHGTARAQFGFFDCADDGEAAAALLGAAEDFARETGQRELAGNFNLTAMQQCGVMTGGFGARGYTDMIVNPPHVPRLLEANGFTRFFPMRTFELQLAEARTEGLRVLDAGDGFRFAPIRKASFAERMEEARAVLNDGFSDNPMFVPLTADEFRFQAGEMMSILDPRLSSVLVKDDRPVGTIICIPDLNGLLAATRSRIGLATPFHYLRYRLRRRRAVIIFYSVVQDMHGQGLMGGMLARTVEALRGAGYEQLGITWIADGNAASLRQMEKLGARPLHETHLFRKEIA
ncbi:RimJ/RimL family protein N-acetyltransferase [Sphingomonas kyeonggiensis]|uniref:GNAT family N-acetyltransferase n=1 Tax=Sphingomonas kyeonggiensis TaxID=1268553 RepID=UPI002783AD4A|nr:GNAT family N-acetyltransferase [Sphingomonas kyeonggiensis]MDQ0250737.1 RimJ/RimL family protein N-acetyltransferase [Sphingomonas kyeonggiensis]